MQRSNHASPLTARQRQVYDFICGYIDDYNVPPTLREIACAFGFTLNASTTFLRYLKAKGWIAWEFHQARTLRPLRRGEWGSVPVVTVDELLA